MDKSQIINQNNDASLAYSRHYGDHCYFLENGFCKAIFVYEYGGRAYFSSVMEAKFALSKIKKPFFPYWISRVSNKGRPYENKVEKQWKIEKDDYLVLLAEVAGYEPPFPDEGLKT